MKVFVVTTSYHHKNIYSLLESIKLLKWEITSFEESDVVFSGNTFFDISIYPEKKFIFGPHFSVLPGESVSKFDNKHKNAIYIQPSPQAVNVWLDLNFNTLPLKCYAFGVDTEKFKPSYPIETRDKVFLYLKRRDPREINFLLSIIKIECSVIIYGRYSEQQYKELLEKSCYGIWYGSHESQGFALQEALSMDVPLLVWNTEYMKDEFGSRDYFHVKSKMESTSYWDESCGLTFTKKEEFEEKFAEFKDKLHTFKPRKFIVDNLSIEKRKEALKELVENESNYK